ncbi:MAG: aminopeptidase [Caldilineaceae bacterium]|nr:aminopeptidase [Caldilineaceae bacterium]
MSEWQPLAERIVQGVNVQPGELIQVRDHVDRPDVLQAVLLAVDLAGATPLIDFQSPAYLNRWLAAASPAALQQSSHHRLQQLRQVDRVIALSGGMPDFGLAAPAALTAWQALDEALTTIEEERQLPVLVVAVPNQQRADRLALTLADLEARLLPAHLLSATQCRQIVAAALTQVAGQQITIVTGAGHTLHLNRGDRAWHGDDGVIDEVDRQRQTIVSNLPAGSIYTTVQEEATHGSLYLPQLFEAREVVFHFTAGRITTVEAAHGSDQVAAWLDSHRGESRRISHIGVGLNPHLHEPIGWTLVDEHIAGAIFVALGENRYMGGQNASSLNHDFALHGASLQVDGRPIVEAGQVVV